MAEDKATLATRRRVVQRARTQVGAHYLLGSSGQKPGEGDLRMLPNILQPPEKQQLFTAQNHKNKCSGKHLSKKAMARLDKKKIGDPVKREHLAHPEKYFWPRVITWQYENRVYGESCLNKRHFDCIGFIYWSLRDVNPKIFYKHLSILEVRNLCGIVNSHGVDHANICVADILIRRNNGHIGLAVGEGTGLVVEAQREDTGVVVSSVGLWDFHGRLPGSFWGAQDAP
jgi:hypothetical protein